MNRYRFIRAERPTYPVALLCRILRASCAGYDASGGPGSATRARADERLTAQVKEAYAQSRGTYGVPRGHAALRAVGVGSSCRRVARLMRDAGLVGRHRRRRVHTTVRDPARPPAPNLVARDFAATEPNRLWIGDITYLRTQEGWLSLAVLLDVYSRRVVAWAMADHLRAELALGAFAMALQSRRPSPGPIHHTDRGCRYTAATYRALLTVRHYLLDAPRWRMPRQRDGRGFFAILEAELVHGRQGGTHAAARTADFEWLEVFYNRQRLLLALAYHPPTVFEEEVLLLHRPAT